MPRDCWPHQGLFPISIIMNMATRASLSPEPALPVSRHNRPPSYPSSHSSCGQSTTNYFKASATRLQPFATRTSLVQPAHPVPHICIQYLPVVDPSPLPLHTTSRSTTDPRCDLLHLEPLPTLRFIATPLSMITAT
jgi:hypothetical protein